MHMLHNILLVLDNHLLIQRFFDQMKGDPSNIYCTKNCFAVKFFCTYEYYAILHH